MLLQRLKIAFAILVFIAVPAISQASELKQETLSAWEDYLRIANLRMQRNLRSSGIRGAGNPFLWIEEQPDRSRRVRQGESRVPAGGEAGPQKVPDGLIHDWIGAIFIANVGINEVLAVVQ